MNGRFCAVAVGFLLASQAHAQGRSAVHGASTRPVELSEAFPWDEPVEQTFTVDSVLRWRRGGPTNTTVRADGHDEP